MQWIMYKKKKKKSFNTDEKIRKIKSWKIKSVSFYMNNV